MLLKIEKPTFLVIFTIILWELSTSIWAHFSDDPHMEDSAFVVLVQLGHMALVSSTVGICLILRRLARAIKSSRRGKRARNRPSTAPHSQRSEADSNASDYQARPFASRTEYTALPGEIRNQIMTFVLLPGRVYLQLVGPTISEYIIRLSANPLNNGRFREKIQKVFEQSERFLENIIVYGIFNLHSGKNSLYPPPNAPEGSRRLLNDGGSGQVSHLLAASNTFPRDWHPWFWSQNTIYLPRGGSEAAEYYFQHVCHEHKALIRCIGIQFSLQDLTPPVLRALEEHICAHPTMLGRRLATLTSTEWARWCALVAVRLWEEKLRWTCHWHYLDLFVLHFPPLDPSLPMKGECLKQDMEGILIGTGASCIDLTHSPLEARPYTIQPFEGIVRGLERKVTVVVGKIGWLGFKQWLGGEIDYDEDWNDREQALI